MAIGSRLWAAFPWLAFSLTISPAQACTLFAAVGRSVQGGGVLIAKNRDRSPLVNGLKVFVPQAGYRHLGLVTQAFPTAPAVAGINEKGLVVVDTSPSSLPLTEEEHSAVPLTQALPDPVRLGAGGPGPERAFSRQLPGL